MTLVAVYRGLRGDLRELAGRLDDPACATPVPALPTWTVKDTYAHLAGVCADAVDGRTDGAPGPSWTARHVAERRDAALAEIRDEWERRSPELEVILDGPNGKRLTHLVLDVWAHAHDIYGALRLDVPRDDPATAFAAHRFARVFQIQWPGKGAPPVRLVSGEREWLLGDGEPVATLHTTDFELARMLIGRRSLRQVLAMDWDGDPEPVAGHLHIFGPPEDDLLE